MKTAIAIYRPGPAGPESSFVTLPRGPSYEEVATVVQHYTGQCRVEHVSVLYNHLRRDLFVDDDGAQKQLPVNEAASAIYRCAWMTRYPKTIPDTLPPIYGVAVLFPDRRVWL